MDARSEGDETPLWLTRTRARRYGLERAENGQL